MITLSQDLCEKQGAEAVGALRGFGFVSRSSEDRDDYR